MNMLITKQINELKNGSKALEDSPLDLYIRACISLELILRKNLYGRLMINSYTLTESSLPILMKIFVLKFNSNTRKTQILPQRNKIEE